MGRKWLLLSFACATVAAAATVAGAASARPTADADRNYREVRRSGRITAELTYAQRTEPFYGFVGQRLVVTRAGARALDVRLTPERSRWPVRAGRALSLVDLDGAEPEVLVSVFTGGANCCFALYVYRHAGGRYRGSFFNSGNAGLTVADLDRDGRREIRSADGRFHYLFSSGAESFYPIRIYRFRSGRLVTVTREFRYHVRQAEIRSWRVAGDLDRQGLNPHTALAAWAANKYLLGEGAEVWPTLQELVDDGDIEAEVEAGGGPYLAALRRKLREFGYLALPQATG
jgi:hypothetical protein